MTVNRSKPRTLLAHCWEWNNMEKGQQILIEDLKNLLAEAEAGEFGDFTNNKYATPKMVLRAKLLELAENVMHGKYD